MSKNPNFKSNNNNNNNINNNNNSNNLRKSSYVRKLTKYMETEGDTEILFPGRSKIKYQKTYQIKYNNIY